MRVLSQKNGWRYQVLISFLVLHLRKVFVCVFSRLEHFDNGSEVSFNVLLKLAQGSLVGYILQRPRIVVKRLDALLISLAAILAEMVYLYKPARN